MMSQTTTIKFDTCPLCAGIGYYRGFKGVWHPCPKCHLQQPEIWCTKC